MLSDRCLSDLSGLSVTLVYCDQTVGWIKMPLGTEIGLGPGHIMLDGDPAPLPPRRDGKGHSSPSLFGPCLLWPNVGVSRLWLATTAHDLRAHYELWRCFEHVFQRSLPYVSSFICNAAARQQATSRVECRGLALQAGEFAALERRGLHTLGDL